MRFDSIEVLDDRRPRSGPWNMAADEVLLRAGGRDAARPILRFYRWSGPAVSLGYFEPFSKVTPDPSGLLAPVRRWTGGGVVRHGEDLTYSLIVPMAALPRVSAREVYRWIHGLVCEVLRRAGISAEMAVGGTEKGPRECFNNPVCHDVMVSGCKVAGAGQRWTRDGLLHQGSIQGVVLPADFRSQLAAEFAERTIERPDRLEEIEPEVDSLARRRYAREDWLCRVP